LKGLQILLAEKCEVAIKILPCLPYRGLQTKWQGAGKSEKLQVMASNVGFC
jgi:hypothetical protein